MANSDTELTLSTGKLLAIFFGLVAICAVFFSLGYAVGKGSGAASAQVITDSSELSAISSTGGAKPVPSKAAPQQPEPSATETPAAAQPQASEPPTTKPEATKPAATKEGSAPAPAMSGTTSTGYMVQVAAVSKREDADALVAALRKKQYPVLVVNNVPNSPYFHVQVGPFAQQKDAEAMRVKLAADGYNAILKK